MKKEIIIFFLIIVLAVIFWSSSMLQDYFDETASFLQDYGDRYPWQSVLIFVLLSVVSTMLLAFSSIWLLPAAIVLWGNLPTFALLLLSWVIGAIFAYIIGRYGGYPIVKMFVSESKIRYYEEFIGERLGPVIIFLFRFTLPSEIPGYILGMFRFPFIKYISITFLAELPYALYAVYAIDSITNSKPEVFFALVTGWLATVLLLIHLYYKKIKADDNFQKISK